MRGIHRWPVTSPHKKPVKRKMFPFDYVFMEFDILKRLYTCIYIYIFLWANIDGGAGHSNTWKWYSFDEIGLSGRTSNNENFVKMMTFQFGKWQFPVQPMSKICSKWWCFRFSVSPSPLDQMSVTNSKINFYMICLHTCLVIIGFVAWCVH